MLGDVVLTLRGRGQAVSGRLEAAGGVLTLSGTYDSGVLKMTGSRGVEYRLTATLRGGQLEGVLEVPPLRFSFQATRVPGQNREKP